jgi:cyclopropane-fatty-acyl-phospholipid synthase
MPIPPWFPFGLRYVFPDGELVTIDETLKLLAGASLEPRDVECRREHYVLTLQEWLRRLEANHERAVRVTDEINYRIFRIYFAAAAYGFKAAMSNLFQVLSVKAGEGPAELPLTRHDWYTERD